MPITTFRQDVTAAIVSSIDAYITANPTLLRRSELARPPSVMGDLPLAFIDGRDERIHFDAQTMDRVMTTSVVIVWPMYDNVETVRLADVLVDSILDHFNGYIQFVANSSWTDVTVGDEDYPVPSDDGSVRHFYATRITFVVSKMEGRAYAAWKGDRSKCLSAASRGSASYRSDGSPRSPRTRARPRSCPIAATSRSTRNSNGPTSTPGHSTRRWRRSPGRPTTPAPSRASSPTTTRPTCGPASSRAASRRPAPSRVLTRSRPRP